MSANCACIRTFFWYLFSLTRVHFSKTFNPGYITLMMFHWSLKLASFDACSIFFSFLFISIENGLHMTIWCTDLYAWHYSSKHRKWRSQVFIIHNNKLKIVKTIRLKKTKQHYLQLSDTFLQLIKCYNHWKPVTLNI